MTFDNWIELLGAVIGFCTFIGTSLSWFIRKSQEPLRIELSQNSSDTKKTAEKVGEFIDQSTDIRIALTEIAKDQKITSRKLDDYEKENVVKRIETLELELEILKRSIKGGD